MIARKFSSDAFVRLNGKYANVVAKIKNIIKEKEFKISDLLSNLNTVDTDNCTIFSTDLAIVTKITEVDHLFFWIGNYCNIYNYDLLKELLVSIECKEAIELIDNFSKELQHSILMELDLLSIVEEPCTKDPFPGIHKLVIKYTGDKCVFKTEKLIRRIICECFHIKTWSLTLVCVEEGCIALIYQISSSVKSHLLQFETTADHITLLRKSHIECIKIDNEVLKMPSGLTKKISKPIMVSFLFININSYVAMWYKDCWLLPNCFSSTVAS